VPFHGDDASEGYRNADRVTSWAAESLRMLYGCKFRLVPSCSGVSPATLCKAAAVIVVAVKTSLTCGELDASADCGVLHGRELRGCASLPIAGRKLSVSLC